MFWPAGPRWEGLGACSHSFFGGQHVPNEGRLEVERAASLGGCPFEK